MTIHYTADAAAPAQNWRVPDGPIGGIQAWYNTRYASGITQRKHMMPSSGSISPACFVARFAWLSGFQVVRLRWTMKSLQRHT